MNTAAQLAKATRLLRAARPGEALAVFDALLAKSPRHAEALNNSAVLLAQRGETERAERRMRAAIESDPEYGQAHFNLALMLRARHETAGALAAFERAVVCEPKQDGWWREYANCALAAGQVETALTAFDRAVALRPGHADAVTNRAVALHLAGRTDEAVAAFRDAVQLEPAAVAAHANLGLLLQRARRWDEAEQALLSGLRTLPGHPLLLQHLATLYLEWGDLGRSEDVATRLITADPQNPEGYNARASVLFERGELDAARREFERARGLDAGNVAAEWNLALLALLDGDLASGLLGFERRRTISSLVLEPRALPGSEWDGGLLDGATIFVHEEQGLGDTLQFVRYATELKQRGAGRVIIECPADAAGLVASVPGVDAVAVRGEPMPPYDVFAPIMSLPFRCGTRLDSIPARTPYFRVSPRAIAATVREAPGALKVGLVWGGNPMNQRDRYRSVPVDALIAATQLDEVTLFSLQKGPHSGELARFDGSARVIDLGPQLSSLDDTAAAINELDLVITVCTSVAHLSGALGRGTWTLLAHVADWRWFRDRDDSPWYPSMRLFRQPAPGDWLHPLGQVRIGLLDLVAHRNAR